MQWLILSDVVVPTKAEFGIISDIDDTILKTDVAIYLEAAKNSPDRILAIYIRDVQHARRARRIEKLIESVSNIEVKLVGSYDEAIDHARAQGWGPSAG